MVSFQAIIAMSMTMRAVTMAKTSFMLNLFVQSVTTSERRHVVALQREGGIVWCDVTWNPLRGCSRVSEGCRNCYAERVASRFSGPGMHYEGLAEMRNGKPRWTGKLKLVEEHLGDPLRWRKQRRVFVNSMSDLLHESVPDEWIDRIFAVMALASRHTFQILTKRPARMLEYLTHPDRFDLVESAIWSGLPPEKRPDLDQIGWPLPNVWLGVSIEDQRAANARIPMLLQTPAAVRFVSCEPLLENVDLCNVTVGERSFADALSGVDLDRTPPLHSVHAPRIDWVIVGGESGRNARPMHPDWARSLRDQCRSSNVAFFLKQWGAYIVPEDGAPACRICGCTEHNACDGGCHWLEPDLCSRCKGRPARSGDRPVKYRRASKMEAGRMLDGREWNEFPKAE